MRHFPALRQGPPKIPSFLCPNPQNSHERIEEAGEEGQEEGRGSCEEARAVEEARIIEEARTRAFEALKCAIFRIPCLHLVHTRAVLDRIPQLFKGTLL